MNSYEPGILVLMLISGFCVMQFLKETNAQGCKNILFLPKKTGSYLRNHVVETLAMSQSTCSSACYLSDSCVSYNFHESTGTCDINDSDEFQHPEDLIARPGYVHVGTQNGCKNRPCPSNAICKADFYNGGVTCLCPKDHTGPNCVRATLGSKERPAKSCLDILVNGFSNGSGVYVLQLNNTGNPIEAYCDMTTDGGGWTKVKRLYLETSIQTMKKLYYSYQAIDFSKERNEEVILTINAMLDIFEKMGFKQIHFYCHKKSVGRVVSIMTRDNTPGYDVVKFFTNEADLVSSFPNACGSFERLPEDTSFVAQNCSLWGSLNSKKWIDKWGSDSFRGSRRISNFPFGIQGDKTVSFSFYRYYRCDDDDEPVNTDDTWQISVR